MSILLDALRKSEKSQQTQEVPTIHSEDQSDPVSESLRIGPLALLLIVALFTSGWLVWRQYQVPAGALCVVRIQRGPGLHYSPQFFISASPFDIAGSPYGFVLKNVWVSEANR